MLSARKNADTAEKMLIDFDENSLEEFPVDKFQEIKNRLQSKFRDKQDIRALVDSTSPNNGAFDYYSALNSQALSTIQRISIYIDVLNSSIDEVASAIEELSAMSVQINTNMQIIETGSEAMLSASEKNSTTVTSLSSEFQHVLAQINEFTLD